MGDQPNAGATSETTQTLKTIHNIHSHNHTKQGGYDNDDYDGQMMPGDHLGLKSPDICLTGEEKPRKKPHPGNLSRPGIEPGPAA